MAELSRRYGVSRPTGYKWAERYEARGWEGLQDESRAPHQHPNAIAEGVEEAILELRRTHPTWGPRKLRARLERARPQWSWPVASTIGALLKREGLVAPRGRRRKTPPYAQPFAAAGTCNAVWCSDFKGWFRTGDGRRCDPLTMSDAYSRYLLRCQAVGRADGEHVRAVLEAAFREYGLPEAMRTDNGPPFAAPSLGGLSRLAVWWIRLGIRPERIAPGQPEQNGRHERMHRTLKAETASPPAADRRAQQRAFDRFRREYNEERPHEALGQQTPASLYAPSPREYPARLQEMAYPAGCVLRRVREHGVISWKDHNVFLTHALSGEVVGLEALDERYYRVYFGPLLLGTFDSWKRHIQRVTTKWPC